MNCFKHSTPVCCARKASLRALLVLFIVLLFSGCVSPPKSEEEPEDAAVDVTTTNDTEAVEPEFIPIPNPYPSKAGSVPSQAKNEFARVKVAMENKNWNQAKELLEVMIATFPKLSGPYVNLGIVHLSQQEFEEAEKALAFAIETNAYNFDAYDLLGRVLREQGKFEDAEKYYLKALELWPHHFASNKNIGILYDLYMGRFSDALKYYELAQKIAGGEDKELKGWIIDLKRRMAN